MRDTLNCSYLGRTGEWGEKGQHLIALRSPEEVRFRARLGIVRDYAIGFVVGILVWIVLALVM